MITFIIGFICAGSICFGLFMLGAALQANKLYEDVKKELAELEKSQSDLTKGGGYDIIRTEGINDTTKQTILDLNKKIRDNVKAGVITLNEPSPGDILKEKLNSKLDNSPVKNANEVKIWSKRSEQDTDLDKGRHTGITDIQGLKVIE